MEGRDVRDGRRESERCEGMEGREGEKIKREVKLSSSPGYTRAVVQTHPLLLFICSFCVLKFSCELRYSCFCLLQLCKDSLVVLLQLLVLLLLLVKSLFGGRWEAGREEERKGPSYISFYCM